MDTTPGGRPRLRLKPSAEDNALALSLAGVEYRAARDHLDSASLRLEDEVRTALLSGRNYQDVGRAAGISRKIPYRVFRELRSDGHPLCD